MQVTYVVGYKNAKPTLKRWAARQGYKVTYMHFVQKYRDGGIWRLFMEGPYPLKWPKKQCPHWGNLADALDSTRLGDE